MLASKYRSMTAKGMISFIAIILLLQIVPLTLFQVDATDAPVDEQGGQLFSIISTFDNSSFSSTSFAQSREIMAKYGNYLYMGYSDEPSEDVRGIMLTRSSDNGSTWEDPVRIWPLKASYGIMVGLEVANGTLLCFIKELLSTDWDDRSIHCVEVPLDDWRNTSKYVKKRLDDNKPGYVSAYDSVKLGDDVLIFWTRSHYIETVYRIRRPNGKWSPIMELDPGNYSSSMSTLVRTVDGVDTLYYYYLYDIHGKIYLKKTNDGINWTEREEILYLEDKPARFEIVDHNDTLHMVVSEYDGFDFYYLSSSDGSNWSAVRKIGTMGNNPYTSSYPGKINVAISSSDKSGLIHISHDHRKGVAVYISDDNGTNFNGPYIFNNTDFSYSTFGPSGNIIFVLNGSKLELRTTLDRLPSTTPPEDDDETDPVQDDDNSTTPDDNSTDQDDDNTTTPDDNSTGQDDDDTNDTDGNSTDDNQNDPQDPPLPQPLVIDEEDVEFEYTLMEGETGSGTVVLKARLDPEIISELDAPVYRWKLDNGSIIGEGEEVPADLEPGEYSVTLEIMDGGSLVYASTFGLSIPDGSGAIDDGGGGMTLLIIFAIIIAIIMVIVPFIIVFKPGSRRKNDHGHSDDENVLDHPGTDHFDSMQIGDVRSGRVPITGSGEIGGFGSRPVMAPAPPSTVTANSKPHEGVKLRDLKKGVIATDVHADTTIRSRDLKKRARHAFEQGYIDSSSLQTINQLLDKDN